MWFKDTEQCVETNLTRWTLEEANGGDAVAQFLTGKRAQRDEEKVHWLRKSAQNGFARASGELGSYYFHPQYFEYINKSECLYWLETSALLREPMSLHNLGLYHIEQKNFEQAVKLFYQAALLGVDLSSFNMAVAYYKGMGGVEQGMVWYGMMHVYGVWCTM
jgi:TPR repeat protein